MKYPIVDAENKSKATIDLNDQVFGVELRQDILAKVVNWQLARRQSGNHKTKQRAEVNLTGKKSIRQKGSGGARHGSRRAGIFVGGGTMFGPQVRSHAFSLNKKVRALGLRVALSQKVREQNLIIMDDFKLSAPKTKDLLKKIKSFDLKSALFVDRDVVEENLKQASANLFHFDVLPHVGLNVYDILHKEKLILTKGAVEALEARLG